MQALDVPEFDFLIYRAERRFPVFVARTQGARHYRNLTFHVSGQRATRLLQLACTTLRSGR
jgi:hypothetical protein